MAQNCNPPDTCPSCSASMRVVSGNPYNLRQCPNLCSGMVWDLLYGWNPATKEALCDFVRKKQRPVKPHVLQPWADYLGRSLRTTYDLAERNHIVGMVYHDGKVAVTIDGQTLVSTLGGGQHVFPLPINANYIEAGIRSGPIMSAAVPLHPDLDRKYPRVEVLVGTKCSGVNWGYTAYDRNGKVIPPPD